MIQRSLFADLMGDTLVFQQALLYMCRAISCNEFQKRTGISNEVRTRFMLPQYYISLRNHTLAALLKTADDNIFVPKNIDSKHVRQALKSPLIALPLLKQLEKQKWRAYTDRQVQQVMADATPAMQKAAKSIAISKLRFLTIFQQMDIKDIEQDLLVKAIQTIGWTFDSRPIQETVLLGCKAMHNHAKNLAEYWSAKKRQNSTERNCNGTSSLRAIHIGSFGHTSSTGETTSELFKNGALTAEDQFEQIEQKLSFNKIRSVLHANKKRKKLYLILTAESSPDFTEWLRRHRVIRGSQTDKHLFEQDPSKYVISGCSFVGFTPKQTTRLMRQLQGEVR